MRLLNASTYELRDFRQRASRPRYAILSHRWFTEEITFNNLNPVELRDGNVSTPQLDKIRGTCRIARGDKLEWVWIDSCCINKDSSEELNRSINSMFKWYQEAAVCYTYLPDVVTSGQSKALGAFEDSEWFERGWTLQELLAPRTMKFFDKNWLAMGTRSQLSTEIGRITGIEASFLDGSETFRTASIATRMSWQARRRTTEEEDIAYSLLGIMGVSLVPTYGDGKQAFLKLQQELLKTYRDESLFAWTAPRRGLPRHDRQWGPGEWGLLAPWVDCFQDCRDVIITGKTRDRPSGGIAPTAEGVKFPIPMSELSSNRTWKGMLSVFLPPFLGPFLWLGIHTYLHAHRREWSLTLNCWKPDHTGALKPIQVFLCRDSRGDEFWRRCRSGDLGSANRIPSSKRQGMFYTKDITIIQPTGVWWPLEQSDL